MSIRAGSRIWLRLAAFPILLALAVQLGDVSGYAADDSFLREMPSAARVLKDMRGNNPLDTAARAAASFTLLSRMMFVRACRTDMRMNAAGLTPQEAQVFQSYVVAEKSVVDPLRATFDPNCRGKTATMRNWILSFQSMTVRRRSSASLMVISRRSGWLIINALKQASRQASTRVRSRRGRMFRPMTILPAFRSVILPGVSHYWFSESSTITAFTYSSAPLFCFGFARA